MPYISQLDRIALNPDIDPLSVKIDTPGKLAYVLYRLIGAITIKKQGFANFTSYVMVTGTVVLTLFEFWRREIAPYEDHKRMENGDV